MKTRTSTTQLQDTLVVLSADQQALYLNSPLLKLKRQGGDLMNCALSCQVDFATYQQIEAQALFNLQPGLKGNVPDEPFSEQESITLKMVLNPQLLEHLKAYTHQPQACADYLLECSQNAIADPLLHTESWFITRVQQQQQHKTIRYQTFWDFVNVGTLKEGFLNQTFLAGSVEFIEQKTQLDLSGLDCELQSQLQVWQALSQANPEQALNLLQQEQQQTLQPDVQLDVKRNLDRLLPTATIPPTSFLPTATVDVTSARATNRVSDPASDRPIDTANYALDSPLFATLYTYLQGTGWALNVQPEQLAITFNVQGQQGEWRCLAQVDEQRQQFCFYSLCPLIAPPERRPHLGEFCVRANFGMIIGNFELNFNTGQLRFRTSIDSEGSDLTSTMLEQLVLTNITTMDQYWPGIMQVTYTGTTAQQAIAAVE